MKFMSPAKMITYGATVTGTVETGYSASSLCDGDPQNPVRTTSTGASFTIAGTSMAGVNGVVLAHTNLDGGLSVTLGGGVTGTLTTPAVPNDRISLNGWASVGPVTASGLTMSVTGNSQIVVIGELIAGVLEDVDVTYGDTAFSEDDYRISGDSIVRRIGYDLGYAARMLTGTMVVNTATLAVIEAWRRACRQTARPSVLIPDSAVNDAWLVLWSEFKANAVALGEYEVTMTWTELTRTRW